MKRVYKVICPSALGFNVPTGFRPVQYMYNSQRNPSEQQLHESWEVQHFSCLLHIASFTFVLCNSDGKTYGTSTPQNRTNFYWLFDFIFDQSSILLLPFHPFYVLFCIIRQWVLDLKPTRVFMIPVAKPAGVHFRIYKTGGSEVLVV